MRALLTLAATAAIASAGEADTFLLRNVTVHPVTSAERPGASVLVRDGRIAEIGGAKAKPPKGVRVVDGGGLHVYPGMIDSATNVGLVEIDAVSETSDITELGDYQPQLRAIAAVNPASEHIPVARANGVTSAVTFPGGGVISGQGALIHLDGWTWEEMAVKPSAAMMMRFPVLSMAAPAGSSARPRRIPYSEAKQRHDRALAGLRQLMEDTRRYQKAKSQSGGQPDTRLEAMIPVIEGKLLVVVRATRERDIREALAFAANEKIRMILAEPRELGDTLTEIKRQRVPVILGPTHSLPIEEDAPYDSQYTLPADLHREGVEFVFGTFDSADVRNLPYQAAAAVAFGLPYDAALAAVTIGPAKLWGVDVDLGSIETGKAANLIVTDGDPLETRTQIRRMFIRGLEVDLASKHTRLYEKYLNRP